jgi:hypothetical protein
MWRTLEADPLFQQPHSTLSVDEQRHLATQQMYRVKWYNFIPLEEVVKDVRKASKYMLVCCIQHGKLHDFFCGDFTLLVSGTDGICWLQGLRNLDC